jgi:hypothetical protein
MVVEITQEKVHGPLPQHVPARFPPFPSAPTGPPHRRAAACAQIDPASALPRNLVCAALCLEAVEQFMSVQRAAAQSVPDWSRPVISDHVLGTFPVIMDAPDLMREFAKSWKDTVKKLPAKAGVEQRNAAFRAAVSAFYPLPHLDPAKFPKNVDDGAPKTARGDAMAALLKNKATADALQGGDAFKPFRIDELMLPCTLR